MKNIHGKDVPLDRLLELIADRVVEQYGCTHLRALADIKAAVNHNIESIIGKDRQQPNPRTWHEIGRDLGVSAQAAHQKYRSRSRKRSVRGQ